MNNYEIPMNRDDLITKADLLEKTPCNFCQEVKPKFLFRATDRQYQTVLDDVWSGVVKCKNCGLIYLSPRVKEKYIGKFYSPSFVQCFFHSSQLPNIPIPGPSSDKDNFQRQIRNQEGDHPEHTAASDEI